jgi:type-F conjugative transfer system pilin assembly protein TrbC
VRRCSLLPASLLSLAAWGAPPGLPDEAALRAEMARQQARGELLMRRAEESFQGLIRAGRRSPRPECQLARDPAGRRSPGGGGTLPPDSGTRDQSEAGPDLLVFVSFAMPGPSLERLAVDAGKAGAVLVFRGPKDGSLRKTLAAFEPLAIRGARATLDPEAFARHRIEAVPVYLLGGAGGCQSDSDDASCQDVLRVSGDAGLDDILERMARADHPLAAVAEARLARLRGKP